METAKSSIACPPPQYPVCWIDGGIPFDPKLPGNNMVCACKGEAAPVLICTVSIQFTDPNTPATTTSAGCDAASVELALAVALAKMLGAK